MSNYLEMALYNKLSMHEISLIEPLSDDEKKLFLSEMENQRKDKVTAILLTVFLGGLGAHHYYLGSIGMGIMYTLFFWTFIPSAIAFIEIFLMSERVSRYNMKKAAETAQKVKSFYQSKSPA